MFGIPTILVQVKVAALGIIQANEAAENCNNFVQSITIFLIGFCDHLSRYQHGSEISVDELCQTIESDSALFFMFRHPPQAAR